ncbi:HAD family hydrolase [Candidatus Dependentiae bacterium]|nr:HAD family hydrolase [Candidatus Dependentiae bacterium]
MTTKNIIFDLDDTIVKTTQHYINTEQYFADLFKPFNIIPREEILELIKTADLKLLEEFKYGYHWYQQGLESVYEKLSEKYNIQISNLKHLLNSKIVSEFQKAPIELWDNAIDILNFFKAKNHNMFIMTLGEHSIQMDKIVRADIKHFFKKIFIVSKKDDNDFNNVIKSSGLIPSESYFVGNSIASDMIPAKKAGFNCILYDKHTTFYGIQINIPDGVTIINDLSELKKIIL